jgi:hypothetical protein
MQSLDNEQINIEIEVVNRELLFSRVNLFQTIDEFEELNFKLDNLAINKAPTITYPKTITVPKHPLLSTKQVKFLFRVVQYKSLQVQRSQLLQLEPIALFAEFYHVPTFLDYIRLNFFRASVNKTSRSVLWLIRNKHLFETRFIQVCLNNTAEHFGTTRERLEDWRENLNTRLTNVNLRKHLKTKLKAYQYMIRSKRESTNLFKRDKKNCRCGIWSIRKRVFDSAGTHTAANARRATDRVIRNLMW